MESLITKMFNDFTSNILKYLSLLFKENKNKKLAEEDDGKYEDTFLSKKIRTSHKDQLALEKEIENKWSIVNKAFELINKTNSITSTECKDFVEELNKWLGKIKPYKMLIKDTKEITFETDINQSIMLDIFIREIKVLFENLLELKTSILLKKLRENPFIKLMRSNYKRFCKLKSIFTELFNGENNRKQELLKILKIDYFQKCINDKYFHPNSLSSILNLKEKNLRILNLNKHYLPFNDGGKLLSYSKFLKTMFESETYLEGMMVLMNTQSKFYEFPKKDIKKSMSQIYKYLLYPIVFPNQEVTKLYGITCINLRFYLSSFVIDNIDKQIDLGYLSGTNDLKRINELKSDCLFDISTGVEFCVFIMTIMHESAHILRRHLVQPKVYIETEEIDKEDFIHEIKVVTRKENKNSMSQASLTINEGGDMLDFIFFGGTLIDLVAEEVRYIFNLNNWKKDLKTFRNEFITIRDDLNEPLKVSKTLMFGNAKGKGPWKCGNKKSALY